jgi:outer membrane receptor protein involved in Fe transport
LVRFLGRNRFGKRRCLRTRRSDRLWPYAEGRRRRAGSRKARNNSYYLPGCALVDAFAAYTLQFDKPITLQLNLKNIFDKTYYTSSIGLSN